MKKPRPRTKFASEADEREDMLDCMCWCLAEKHHGGVVKAHMAAGLSYGTLGDLTDGINELLLSGQFQIDFDEAGDRFRIEGRAQFNE
jgi:hypothetical protein